MIYYPLAEYFSLAWYGATFALVFSIELINKLPNVLIDRIYFDLPMALITSFIILALIIHQHKTNPRLRSHITVGVLLLILLDFRSIWSNQDIQRVTQYQNKNSRIVEVQNGLNSFLIVDDDITDKTISNTVLGNQIKNNIKESSTIRIKKGEDLGF